MPSCDDFCFCGVFNTAQFFYSEKSIAIVVPSFPEHPGFKM